MKNRELKFSEIIVSYTNGNIAWAKAEAKKLSKSDRKMLYKASWGCGERSSTAWFFFELI